MTNNNAWYYILPDIFKYLEVYELLKAAQVCRMWRDSAADSSLWKTVHLKNCQVTDWKALTDTLERQSTQNLDLRGMLAVNEYNDWENEGIAISRITSLIKLKLCRCSGVIVQEVIKSCPQLNVLNAMSIKHGYLNLESIDNLKKCQELRLGAEPLQHLCLQHNLTPLQNLTQLTHLSLTSIFNLGSKNVDVIQALIKLETLELGDCWGWPENFGTNVLQKLQNLKRLRLEYVMGSVSNNINNIFQAISKLKDLNHVELTHCDLSHCETTYSCLANCKNIKQLLITTSHLIHSKHLHKFLKIIKELSNTLAHFVFGVRVNKIRNKIFCDMQQLMTEYYFEDTLPQIQKLLLIVLSKTRITIFKIDCWESLLNKFIEPRISDIVT